jgi:hypothetical protein
MPTLKDLDKLAKWMREHGATHARMGEVELDLGAEAKPVGEGPEIDQPKGQQVELPPELVNPSDEDLRLWSGKPFDKQEQEQQKKG